MEVGFSHCGVDTATSKLKGSGSSLDASENGVHYVALNEKETSVGVDGLRDERGALTLEAALMPRSG